MPILMMAAGTVFVAAAFNLFIKADDIPWLWIVAPICLLIGLMAFSKAYVCVKSEERERKTLEAAREAREAAREAREAAREAREDAREERDKARFEQEKSMWEKFTTPNDTEKDSQP